MRSKFTKSMNLYADTQIFNSHWGDMKGLLCFDHLSAFLCHAAYFSFKTSINKNFNRFPLRRYKKIASFHAFLNKALFTYNATIMLLIIFAKNFLLLFIFPCI